MQNGAHALHLAAEGGHVSTIQYLAPRMESLLDSNDNNGYTMLHWAAQNGHTEVVELAIEEFELDPNVRDKVPKHAL